MICSLLSLVKRVKKKMQINFSSEFFSVEPDFFNTNVREYKRFSSRFFTLKQHLDEMIFFMKYFQFQIEFTR